MSEIDLLESLDLQQADSRYRSLAKHVVRTFYSGLCPPPEWEERNGGATTKKKIDTSGLAIVIIDALTAYQWVKEDDLAAKLGINQKTMRRAVVYLADELIIRRESHREHKPRERKKDPAAADGSTAAPAEEEEVEEARVQRTYGYVSIDYPRLYDITRLRIHMLRDRLRRELEGGEAVQQYKCSESYCERLYTSLDILNIISMDTGKMACEVCQGEVKQVNTVTGQAINADQQQQRKKALSALRGRLDREVRPITELMSTLAQVPAPFFGALQQWQHNMKIRLKNKMRMEAARGGGAGGAGGFGGRGGGWAGLAGGNRGGGNEITIDGELAATTEINVKLNDEGAAAPAGPLLAAGAKLPWLGAPAGKATAGAAAQEESKPGADEQAAAAADISWMDDVEAFFGGGILGDAGGLGAGVKEEPPAADVKMEEAADVDDGTARAAKRARVEDAAQPSQEPPIKMEQEAAPAAPPAADDEDDEWEDVTAGAVPTAPAAVEPGAAAEAVKEEAGGAAGLDAAGDDDEEWEDV